MGCGVSSQQAESSSPKPLQTQLLAPPAGAVVKEHVAHNADGGQAPQPPPLEGSPAPLPTALEPQLLVPEPRPPVGVRERGVSLSFLKLLVSSGEVDADWTVQEVVDRFVRPRSAGTRCCLFDMVPAARCGKPRFFISHTWSRKLGDLLGLLRAHFQDVEGAGESLGDSILLWLDIVAINQHPYADRGCLQNDDVASLALVVAATETTLFCLDEQCISLTRIWCLYEVWQTFLAKGPKGLLVLTSTVDVSSLRRVFETFDVLKAQATQPEDRDRILDQIQGSIGATELNLQLKGVLVGSAVYEAEHSAGLGRAAAEAKAGQLLSASGRHGEAEGRFRAALEVRTRELGPEDADTVSSVNDLAICVSEQGRNGEAEPMYRGALAAVARAKGPEDPDALSALDNLASCVRDQGRYKEAEQMYRQALEARVRVLGEDHPESISSVSNLAASIGDQGRHAEAEPICRQALAARVRVLGEDHPQTLASLGNVALCLKDQGRFSEAEPMLRQALEGWVRVFGAEHPDALASVADLATCLCDQGRDAEAEPLCRRALEGRAGVLGAEHPHTVASLNNLGLCVRAQGREAEAEPLLRRALEAMSRVLGADHPDTVASMGNLAGCLGAQGRVAEAEASYLEALEACRRVLGPEAPATGDALFNLAAVLDAAGRGPEARGRFREAAEVYASCYGPEHAETRDAEAMAERAAGA